MEFIAGNIENIGSISEQDLWNRFENYLSDIDGIFGYKMPSVGNKDNDSIPSFFVRSKSFGIILIDVLDEKLVKMDDKEEYWTLEKENTEIRSREFRISDFESDIENRLKKSTALYDHRRKKFKVDQLIKRVLILSKNDDIEVEELKTKYTNSFFIETIISKNSIDDNTFLEKIFVELKDKFSDDYINDVDSILETTEIFNKASRVGSFKIPTNQNDLINLSLQQTFKLDETQRKVALQLPNGPQRIRGLAGTGKTIILCLKAALALKDPSLKILFVFNTQSMYNQIKDCIQKYYNAETGDLVDWNNLKIFHAWGGKQNEGLYSYLCKNYEYRARTFNEVRFTLDPYEYIYKDFLSNRQEVIKEEFDLVLIDEAQDFPPIFFETIYHITKKPKRIIWAYDEFQSLKEMKITSPSEIFGVKENGTPNISDEDLKGEYAGKIQKDYILPNSYRNPRKVLMFAHGLGMGLYSMHDKLPMVAKISWEARGYNVISPNKPTFSYQDHIIVERPNQNSRNNLENLIENYSDLKVDSIIKYISYNERFQELEFVVRKIDELVNKQNVAPEEILVISLNNKAEALFSIIRSKLNSLEKQILCITPGFVEKTDQFKEKDRVTLSTVFRAKGNEANFVFVMCCEQIYKDLRQRNSIFVAITRSRGWTYLTASGEMRTELEKEIRQINENYPKFVFDYPKDSDIERKYQILSREDNRENRQIEQDMEKILSNKQNLALLIDKAKSNPELLDSIKKLLGDDGL